MGTLCVRPQSGVQIERYEAFGEQTTALIQAGVGWLVDKPGNCAVYHAGKPVRLPDPLKPYRGFTGQVYSAATGGFYGSEATFIESLRTGKELSPTLAESLRTGRSPRRCRPGAVGKLANPERVMRAHA